MNDSLMRKWVIPRCDARGCRRYGHAGACCGQRTKKRGGIALQTLDRAHWRRHYPSFTAVPLTQTIIIPLVSPRTS